MRRYCLHIGCWPPWSWLTDIPQKVKLSADQELKPPTHISASATAITNTTELSESILIHLDCKTLLFARKVCCKWNDVISANKQLQQKLFMLPATLEEAIAPGLADNQLERSVKNRYVHDLTTILILNPLLFNGPGLFTALSVLPHRRGSCDRMFFTNPPRDIFGILNITASKTGHSKLVKIRTKRIGWSNRQKLGRMRAGVDGVAAQHFSSKFDVRIQAELYLPGRRCSVAQLEGVAELEDSGSDWSRECQRS